MVLKNFALFSIVTNYQVEDGSFKKELLFFRDQNIADDQFTKWNEMIPSLTSEEEWNFIDH